MNPPHRRFVAAVEKSGAIRRLAAAGISRAVTDAYDAALAAFAQFRRAHLAIVTDYIARQADPGTPARGTGGTDFGRFLAGTLAGVRQARLRGRAG